METADERVKFARLSAPAKTIGDDDDKASEE